MQRWYRKILANIIFNRRDKKNVCCDEFICLYWTCYFTEKLLCIPCQVIYPLYSVQNGLTVFMVSSDVHAQLTMPEKETGWLPTPRAWGYRPPVCQIHTALNKVSYKQGQLITSIENLCSFTQVVIITSMSNLYYSTTSLNQYYKTLESILQTVKRISGSAWSYLNWWL